jgi:RNA polymerase sigma factor (sigma-70 family)
MLRVWRGIGRLRGRSLFFAWLYRIAINEANRSLEKSSRRPMSVSIDAEALRVPADAQDEPSRKLEQTQLRQALSKALAELPPDYRTCCDTSKAFRPSRPQRLSASARPRSRAARTRRG